MTIRSTPSACTEREERSGALLTGVFASSVINPIFKDANGNALPSGAIQGNFHQLLNQLIGVAIAWVLAIVGTLIILKIVDLVDRAARRRGGRSARPGSHSARRRGLLLGDIRVASREFRRNLFRVSVSVI